jgi:hypothetical protein
MSSTTLRRASAAAVVAAALVLATPAAVYAGHGGQANSGTPDNTSHGVDRNSISSLGDSATKHGIAQLNRTKMDASLATSGDVEVYDGYYGNSGDWNGVAGSTDCIDSNWYNNVCNVYRVRFNQSNMSSYSSDWRVLGCHELGHTAGLGHRYASTDSNDNSCMRSGLYTTANEDFDTHDIDAINATPM